MRLTLDATMREAMAKLSFRDVLLSREARGRSGVRNFLALPGVTREIAACEIVRIFGVNRYLPGFEEDDNEDFQAEEHHNMMKHLQFTQSSVEHLVAGTNLQQQQQQNGGELLLNSPIHSIFGRHRVPISFLLDIDCKTPDSAGGITSTDVKKIGTNFQDRVLGFCINATRAAFAKNGIVPSRIAVLTAAPQIILSSTTTTTSRAAAAALPIDDNFASFHVHIDMEGAAFADSMSLGSFIRTELLPAMRDSSSNNNKSSPFAQKMVDAVDVLPFMSVGGSLRVYGAPKQNGARPLRLYEPSPGGAAATAIMALGARHGGPTVSILNETTTTTTSSSSSSATTTKNPNAHLAEKKLFSHKLPLRKIELEALAMSLGTPDWMSPVPIELMTFKQPQPQPQHQHQQQHHHFSQQQGGNSNTTTTNTITTTGTPSDIDISMLPEDLQNHFAFWPNMQGRDLARRAPVPRRGSSPPEAYALGAIIILAEVPGHHARPYRTWLHACLALTDIAVHNNANEELEERLKEAFLKFSEKGSNYNYHACLNLWNKTMNRKKRENAAATARNDKTLSEKNADRSYISLVRLLD